MAGDIKEGRPLIFKNKEELQIAIDKYFEECRTHKKKIVTKSLDTIEIDDPLVPTIAGLAYALNTSRQTIYNYSERDEFFDTIKKSRDYVLSEMESKLVNSDSQVTGAIFLAKNYGYSDKQEIEHSGGIKNEVIEDKEQLAKEILEIIKDDIKED